LSASQARSEGPRLHATKGIRAGAGHGATLRYLEAPASGVAHRIGRDIVGGHFEQDALLPNEVAMRERYSVSRTALREAYSKLTAKGLIAARPKVGTSVRAKIHWNMLDPEVLSWHLEMLPPALVAADLYALRRMVEPGAAELAARLHSPDDAERIDRAFRDMGANASDRDGLVEADFRFHLAILAATKNPFINAFSGLIRAAMLSTFELSWRGAEMLMKERRLAQHGAVADAIRDRDAAAARRCMEELLDESIRDVSEGLQRG